MRFLAESTVQLRNGLRFSLAEIPHLIQHLLGGKMVADNLSRFADINHIEWMQPVLMVDVDRTGTIL